MIVTSHWWQYWGRLLGLPHECVCGGIKLEQLQYGTGSSVGFVGIRKPWESGWGTAIFRPILSRGAQTTWTTGVTGISGQPPAVHHRNPLSHGTWHLATQSQLESSSRNKARPVKWWFVPGHFFDLVGKCKLNDDLMRIYQWFILW